MLHCRWAASEQPWRQAPAVSAKFVRRSSVAYFIAKFRDSDRFPKLHSGPEPSGDSATRTAPQSNGRELEAMEAGPEYEAALPAGNPDGGGRTSRDRHPSKGPHGQGVDTVN